MVKPCELAIRHWRSYTTQERLETLSRPRAYGHNWLNYHKCSSWERSNEPHNSYLLHYKSLGMLLMGMLLHYLTYILDFVLIPEIRKPALEMHWFTRKRNICWSMLFYDHVHFPPDCPQIIPKAIVAFLVLLTSKTGSGKVGTWVGLPWQVVCKGK